MDQRRYTEVDVFAQQPYRGNALAVVHDADGLTSDEMQRFATWTNLSETTFLLTPTKPEADYRVRIFSATEELPFAGHPTLGSAKAWLDAGGETGPGGRIVQECAAGLVPVRVIGDRMAFQAPPLTRYEPVEEALVSDIAGMLGVHRSRILGASWLVNGPAWIGVRLTSGEEVLALNPDPAAFGSFEVGVIGPHLSSPADDASGIHPQFEVRAFVGGDPVFEDPVTGSLNAGLAQWLHDTDRTGSYVAAQGTAIGRQGRVHITIEDDGIWVGGHVTTCVQGTIRI